MACCRARLPAAPPDGLPQRHPTNRNGFGKLLPNMTRVRVKPRLKGKLRRKIAALKRYLRRNRAARDKFGPNNTHSCVFWQQIRQTPLINSHPNRQQDLDPLADSPPNHRPGPPPWTAVLQTINQTRAPANSLGTSARITTLTNSLPNHHPGAEGPHDAAPDCACATPLPSDAPIARGLSPLCAPHRPSSIRS